MIFAAIDPSLDGTGIALFDTAGWPPSHSYERAAEAFRGWTLEATRPDTPMERRLGRLHDLPTRLSEERGVAAAYIEAPAMFGAYQRHRGKGGRDLIPASMASFWQALGAIRAGCEAAGLRVVMVPASKTPKGHRHQLVRAALGPVVATGPRGGDLADVLDAIYVGLSVLVDPALRPRE